MRSLIQILGCLLMIAHLGGCAREHPPGAFLTSDRLVATNRFRASLVVTVTGSEAKQIAKAVAASRPDDNAYGSIEDCQIEFYSGTNLLSTIYVQGPIFLLGNTLYHDRSGVLGAFYDKWQTESYLPIIDEGG